MKRIFFLIPALVFLSACASRPAEKTAPDITISPKVIGTSQDQGDSEAKGTPVALSYFGFTGRLIFILYRAEGNRLVELDLASGEVRTLFQAPEDSWLAAAAVSPGEGPARQIALAYSPPVSDNRQIGYTGLYLIPYEGAGKPQPIRELRAVGENYAQPAWSPDGKSIYYAHLDPSQGGSAAYRIERADLERGAETLVENAYWPVPSPDGSRLAFLTYDPSGQVNEPYLGDAAGQDARPLTVSGAFPAVDAIMFSPDGSMVYFSAVNDTTPAPASWLDRLLGVTRAAAHSMPSDWYRVPVGGGPAERLTFLGGTGLAGAVSPGGDRIAFISDRGLFVMGSGGQDLVQLAEVLALGTVAWVH